MVSLLETIGFSIGNQWFLREKPLEADRDSNGIYCWDDRKVTQSFAGKPFFSYLCKQIESND
jgi:hypothetical protein